MLLPYSGPVLALLAPVLAAAQVPAATTLSPDTESRWVPFQLTASNQILFDVRVDGRAARALLDTGLSDTLVTSRFAREAALKPTRTEQASAIGGALRIGWVPATTIAFGGLTRSGARIGISDAPEQERFGVDMFVGADVLGCCALDIDYEARRFRILKSGRLPYIGTTVPLSRHRVYLSEAQLAGKRIRPLIVDTGDGGSLTLSRTAWARVGDTAPATTTLGWGLGGAVVSDLLVMPSLVFGRADPVETEVRVEGDQGYSASVGAAGRIGNGLLLRYRVLLDPSAGRMVLVPGPAAGAPVVRSTSGLLLGRAGGRLQVVHVMRGSPASQGGWRDGETICAVDGQPVDTAEAATVNWTAGPPGRTIRLTLCNGSDRSLTLRRFY